MQPTVTSGKSPNESAATSEEAAIRRAVEFYLLTVPGECFAYGRWPFDKTIGLPPPVSRNQALVLSRFGLGGVKFETFYSRGRLTEKGRSYYYPNIENRDPYAFGNAKGALCIGQRKFVSLDEFTVPANFFGRIVTDASYAYRLIKVPDWARTPEFSKEFPKSARFIRAGRITSTIRLVKTTKGRRLLR